MQYRALTDRESVAVHLSLHVGSQTEFVDRRQPIVRGDPSAPHLIGYLGAFPDARGVGYLDQPPSA